MIDGRITGLSACLREFMGQYNSFNADNGDLGLAKKLQAEEMRLVEIELLLSPPTCVRLNYRGVGTASEDEQFGEYGVRAVAAITKSKRLRMAEAAACRVTSARLCPQRARQK